MNSTDIIRDYIDNQLGYSRTTRTDVLNTDEITLPSGENIIISYSITNITNSTRSNPQIRIKVQDPVKAFKIACHEKKRFFFMTIYCNQPRHVAQMSNITPGEYIVSIETDMNDISGRMDIRSLYEWLDNYTSTHGSQEYIRCNKSDHTCSIFQASFIRIKNGTTNLTAKIKEYLGMFDLRPYFVTSLKSFNYAPNTNTDKKNIIAFGAPGTGKSYGFKKKLDDLGVLSTNYERVTFFADYSYSQFVGTYKPIEIGGTITYKFVPGPFMRVLKNALESGLTNSPENFYLIIEEINRAKAAAVFGDMFQLLDRDDSGKSEYAINASEDVRAYLADAFGGSANDYSELRIPNNMYIYATMNSADQGVFPIDTAFKRRWGFNYIGVDDEEFKIVPISGGGGHVTLVENQNDTFNLADGPIEWNVLRRAINLKLSNERIRMHEDKLMGPFFIKVLDASCNSIFNPATKDADFIELFCDKVLMYLFEDAAKTKRPDLFEGIRPKEKLNRYSFVCSEFRRIGLGIFGSNFRTNEYSNQETERNNKRTALTH